MSKTNKKLSLSRETIKNLDASALSQANGGVLLMQLTAYTHCGSCTGCTIGGQIGVGGNLLPPDQQVAQLNVQALALVGGGG